MIFKKKNGHVNAMSNWKGSHTFILLEIRFMFYSSSLPHTSSQASAQFNCVTALIVADSSIDFLLPISVVNIAAASCIPVHVERERIQLDVISYSPYHVHLGLFSMERLDMTLAIRKNVYWILSNANISCPT